MPFSVFTEDTFEQAVIAIFEKMGYEHIYAPDIDGRDYSSPLLDDVLEPAQNQSGYAGSGDYRGGK